MPISLLPTSHEVTVTESFESPSVYLDHWAIRKFSDCTSIQDRLVDTIIRKGGTLLLSPFSFAEFAKADDVRHCIAAEYFIERLLPNIFLTNYDLEELVSRELKEPNNAIRLSPPIDHPQLNFLAKKAVLERKPLSLRGLFKATHDNRVELTNNLKKNYSDLVKTFGEVQADASYLRKAKHMKPEPTRTRTTLIMAELSRGFHLDAKIPSENDAIDLVHAVIPINVCDFVLLDGPWEQRVEKMRQRIDKTDRSMSIAACFSERNNGVERFLMELDNFQKLS